MTPKVIMRVKTKFLMKILTPKSEQTSKTTISAKVIHVMKKLQASYKDANKFVKEAVQEKRDNKLLNSLIDLAMVASNIKPTDDEPWTFKKAWNHPNETRKLSKVNDGANPLPIKNVYE